MGHLYFRRRDSEYDGAAPVNIVAVDSVNLILIVSLAHGAEATVHGWIAKVGPHGRRVLDVLFVELVNPPRAVSIPGLPLY